jgi:quercetin dioxygenase-like cupin family protein
MIGADMTPSQPQSGEELRLTPRESVRVLESTPERLVLAAGYEPGGEPPPPHSHPAQAEHFEVLSGRLRVKVDGEERTIAAPGTLDVPAGAVHQMWNAGDERASVRWEVAPRGRSEEWFRAVDSLYREGRVGSNGEPGLLAFSVLLTEYRDVFRLGLGPDALTRPLLAGLAVLGRARGYSASA